MRNKQYKEYIMKFREEKNLFVRNVYESSVAASRDLVIVGHGRPEETWVGLGAGRRLSRCR